MSLTSKVSFLLFFSLLSQASFGQKYSVEKKNKSYFGITAGFNFSAPRVTDRYSILSAVGSTEDARYDKEYDKFGKNRGAQFGVQYSYNFSNWLSIVTGFGYQSLGFNYITDYSWADSLANQNLEREMHHLQKISYFTVPIMVRWDMTKGQLIPFIQGGIFMDFRHQARKVIHYDNVIDGEVVEDEASSSALVSITESTRKFNMGLMLGAGVNYHTKFATFGIETNFRSGFYKTINDQTRYSDINGFALQYLDVLDQLRLNVLSVQFSLSIPINHSVATNILRKRRY